MGVAHVVAVRLLELLDVELDELVGGVMPVYGRRFVPVGAAQFDRLAVDEERAVALFDGIPDLNLTKAKLEGYSLFDRFRSIL